MDFVNAGGKGFVPSRMTFDSEGNVYVEVGANVNGGGRYQREEEVVLTVRIDEGRNRSITEVQTAALQRAASLLTAAAEALTKQI
jgi:hypothetical protein